MNDLSLLLTAAEQGDTYAAQQLLPLVYAELRRLAAQKLGQERSPQTLDATGLVHEAYLRLVPDGPRSPQEQQWDGRGHFFAAAAEAMRRILVENARRRSRLKHGGGRQRVNLSDPAADKDADELVALDGAPYPARRRGYRSGPRRRATSFCRPTLRIGGRDAWHFGVPNSSKVELCPGLAARRAILGGLAAGRPAFPKGDGPPVILSQLLDFFRQLPL